MPNRPQQRDRGPYRAEQFVSGDPYELSNGHRIECFPTGARGGGPNAFGASVVGTDPMVEEYGVDVGYSPEPGMLRAPDIAVGNVPKNKPGWVAGVPALAIEYADEGQDEDALERKIDDLLGAGTQYLWVVRLSGPRRVEVHEKGKPKRVVRPGAQLKAPGVLQNPVLVEALYDRDEAERATLRNLLQRQGYASVDALLASAREEGVAIGREEGAAIGAEVAMAIRNLCEANGLPWSRERAARFSAMSHAERLDLLELLKREGRWD